jgi:predicted glycosyltransferase
MEQPFREKIQGKPHQPGRKARILVAPLDWGLGHATRCIPIIRELLEKGCDVWLAGEGAQEQLLRNEFPELPFLALPGYRIRYAKTARGLIWKMIMQGPKMQRAIQYEHQWLKKMVQEQAIDAVISDNRFGLNHPGIPCIFMTHQLLIKSAAGKWTEKILQRRNYRFINRFTACWVPDRESANTIAGELSHPPNKPQIPVHYIGLLSRFIQKASAEKAGSEKKGHLLIILSGPEPQRTMLEEKIIREISHYNGTATIVRGLPGQPGIIPSTNMLQFYNHLPAEALNEAMHEAEYVISRSGYSTVMDILALGKKSILVPTPGQTEQEYLGKFLLEKRTALCVSQENFVLNNALAAAAAFPFDIPPIQPNEQLEKAIEELLLLVSR